MASPIWNEKESRWVLRVTQDGITKKFTSSKKGLAGKKEVLKKSRDYIDNGYSKRSTARVAEVWQMYLNDFKARNGAKSKGYVNNESIGRNYLLPNLAARKVSSLTKTDFQNIINNATPINKNRCKELSKEYLRDIRGVFTQFIKYCWENGYCEEFRGSLYVPKGHPVKGQISLQADQIQRLFQPSDLHFHNAFLFMVVAGMRPSELLGLQWDDVDRDCIHIRRGINSRNVITDGKTKNARRNIPLNSLLRKILLDQENKTKHLHSEWIFCNKIGAHGTLDNLRKCYDKLKAERALDGSPYTMRHTFVSLMKNELPVSIIKEIVGHSDSMPTLDIYGHPIDNELKHAAEVIDLTFANYIMEEQK